MDNTVTISLERYDQLLDIETRVDIVTDMAVKSFQCAEDIYKILGIDNEINAKKAIDAMFEKAKEDLENSDAKDFVKDLADGLKKAFEEAEKECSDAEM